MRWLTNSYDFKFKSTATTTTGIHPTKSWLSQLVNFKNAIWTWGHFRRTICNKIVLNLENATLTYGMLQTAFRPSWMNRASVFEWHKKFKEGRESVRDDERCGRSKEVNTTELIGQRVRLRVRVTMLRFYGSSGGDSLGRGQHSSNRVSGISTRTIHQSTTPSFSQTIWPRWASRHFFTIPIVETLLPVTFSLCSEAVVMRQLRRWKRLWRRSLTRSHKKTSMGPSRSFWNGTSALQLEEITSTRVSCVYYQ